MKDSFALPEVVGDNPPLPDLCPLCSATPEVVTVFHTRYRCGAVYAPIAGRMPTVWGGNHPAAVDPNKPAPEPMRIPVQVVDPSEEADTGPTSALNPQADLTQLNAALQATISYSLADYMNDRVSNATDIVSKLASDIEAMLTSGKVPTPAK